MLILKWAMEQCVDIAMLSKLWMKLYSNALFMRLSEFMKVVVLAMVQNTRLVNGWEMFFLIDCDEKITPQWKRGGEKMRNNLSSMGLPFVMELAIYKQTTMMHYVTNIHSLNTLSSTSSHGCILHSLNGCNGN
jgi:hypothetical protein